MKRAHRNTKLSKFSALANKIKALGFDSVVIFANEKNGAGGQTYLSVGNSDDEQEREFEKVITQLLARVGTTPSEISSTLEALKHLGEMGSLSLLLARIRESREEITDSLNEGTRRKTKREEETDAFDKLSKEDQKRVTKLRREKNKLVKQKNYEEASKVRDMERTILGMNETKTEEDSQEEQQEQEPGGLMTSLHEYFNAVLELGE